MSDISNDTRALLKALETLIAKADDLEAAIAGVTDQFEPEVAALSAAVSATAPDPGASLR